MLLPFNSFLVTELQETARMANDNRVLTLKNKLVALGRLYSKAERYFPIGEYFSWIFEVC